MNRKAYLQAGGRVANGACRSLQPPLGTEATEASQKTTTYGKATPSEAHRPEDVSPAGPEPVKVRKDFLK